MRNDPDYASVGGRCVDEIIGAEMVAGNRLSTTRIYRALPFSEREKVPIDADCIWLKSRPLLISWYKNFKYCTRVLGDTI